MVFYVRFITLSCSPVHFKHNIASLWTFEYSSVVMNYVEHVFVKFNFKALIWLYLAISLFNSGNMQYVYLIVQADAISYSVFYCSISSVLLLKYYWFIYWFVYLITYKHVDIVYLKSWKSMWTTSLHVISLFLSVLRLLLIFVWKWWKQSYLTWLGSFLNGFDKIRSATHSSVE